MRGVISPSYREISTSPGAYYQFLSIVENSGNSQVNWALSPVSGGLQLTYPPSGNGTATAGPANYVFYRPPSSLGGYTQQFVILSGTPAVGGQAGNATLLLRTDPYAPPIVCRASTINVAGCLSPTETNLPASLSANASSMSWMRIESHYTGNNGIATDGRLHRTMRVAYALDPNNPFDNGLNACIIRIERSLGYGAPDGQQMFLEGGPSPTNASIGPGAPANSTITNGVCTVSRPLTNVSVNFAADSTKAWLDIYIRFNAPSAPRSVFYAIDSYNNTSSGTVLVKDTALPVVP